MRRLREVFGLLPSLGIFEKQRKELLPLLCPDCEEKGEKC
jgi:hypothetical protein